MLLGVEKKSENGYKYGWMEMHGWTRVNRKNQTRVYTEYEEKRWTPMVLRDKKNSSTTFFYNPFLENQSYSNIES